MSTDQPEKVAEHAGRYDGGVCLAVLGGPSGERWGEVRDAVDPDVIITANGATRLPGAEYWLLTENMNHCHTRATVHGDERLAKFLHVLDKGNTARFLFISHRSWNLLRTYEIDEGRCTSIRRSYPADLSVFSLREYGAGLLAGPLSQAEQAWKPGVKVRLGTVGTQLLHLAGILGCAEVHTIGFDLLLGEQSDHWYEHPRYDVGIFRTPQQFVTYKGKRTQVWWVETAQWLKEIEWIFERDGLRWRDHSEGLLTIEGLKCANP